MYLLQLQDVQRDVIRRVMEAYRARPIELAILATGLTLLIGGLWAYNRTERARYRKERRRRAQAAYDEKVQQHKIPPSWQSILERMSLYLPNSEDKYLLLENEWMFNSCAQKLLKEAEAPADAIAALRLHLGFAQNREKAPSSTVHLPQASTVFVRRAKGQRPVRGRVMAPEPHAFRVVVPPEEHFKVGSTVDVFYQNQAGIFQIQTLVQNIEDNVLSLRHSESLTRYQKRKYFRRRMRLPVLMRPVDSDEPAVDSILVDLGGGGASVRNPKQRYRAGDRLELRFAANENQRLQVIGEVVRTSRNDELLHLRFVSIREPVRDKIFQTIFTPRTPARPPASPSGSAGASTSGRTTGSAGPK